MLPYLSVLMPSILGIKFLHAFTDMDSMVSMQYFSRSANFLRFNRKQNIYKRHVQSSDGRLKAKVEGIADKSFFGMTSLISSEQLRMRDCALSDKCCLRKNLFIRHFESSSSRGRIILPACALLSLKRKVKSLPTLSRYQRWKDMAVGRLLKNTTISLVKLRTIYRNMQAKQKQKRRKIVVKRCWWGLGLRCLLVVGLCLFLQIPMGNCLAPTGSQALDCFDAVNYYKGTEGLKGRALKLKLHKIVDGHLALSYAQVWDALKILDAADETSLGIPSKV
ncbi:hypothetical protein O6H91_Y162400 [Diphasiastrum complanatum]|nr:hypothetical protein O6H91_Y162400 [Diphasiastrum complanatum]